MSVPYQLNDRRRDDYIQQAVERRVPVALSVKSDEGWVNYKSRFLAIESETNELVVEYPTGQGDSTAELSSCQNVGVSFRRGHKKCMFSSMVVGRYQYTLSDGTVVPAVRVAAPAQMFELQRRMFYRTPIPNKHEVEIEARPTGAESVPSITLRGRLLDLSAGGLSFALPREQAPRWAVNTPLVCSIRGASKSAQPIEAPAQYRHCGPLDEPHVRVGLQFAGLDASPDGRKTLQQILDLTCELQRA